LERGRTEIFNRRGGRRQSFGLLDSHAAQSAS
jgi:hypothetical protein